MGGSGGKTPRSRALGRALAEARNEHGLSQRQLADKISRSPGAVARWELGDRMPDPTDVAQVLTALGVSGQRYDEILSMAHGGGEPRWLAVTLPEQRAQLAALLDLETTAKRIVEVAPLLIPGLLQTSDYVRELMTAARVPADELSTRVAVRIGRRDVITRQEPAHLLALIGEAALRQIMGNAQVMVQQLKHLQQMAELPNVELRVIPFDTGWHPGLEGMFLLIEPADGSSVVHLENRRSGLFLHEEDDLDAYRQAVDAVLEAALSPANSIKLISDVIKDLEATA